MTGGAPHRLPFRRPLPDGSTALEWRGAALMGIVNVTPDSFSDAGETFAAEAAVAAGLRLREEGALILDVGGESTRPGALPVSPEEEARRVLPVVAELVAAGAVVSIDTRKAEVAAAALAAGAAIVNDVGGLRDPAMLAVCAAAGAPVVIMHMQGEPRTMQAAPAYADVVAEVEELLLRRARLAEAAGLPGVVLDPGIGFGKDLGHNLALLRATPRLAGLGHPLMVGASRKAFIGRLAGGVGPGSRLPGTLAAHLAAAAGGAALLRVHDVAAHAQALAVAAAVAEGK
ncbi:MAG: dihydropteroate synthase [Trueperaceae bacterium]|nr:dihydropteroate synthase [Trueperaceae bacterium]MCO5174110.1 dihydropteroate synthase [Trueperaceae bacterium]